MRTKRESRQRRASLRNFPAFISNAERYAREFQKTEFSRHALFLPSWSIRPQPQEPTAPAHRRRMRRRKGGIPLTAHTGKNAGTGRGGVASLVTNRPPSGDDNFSYLRPVGGLLLGSPSVGYRRRNAPYFARKCHPIRRPDKIF